MSTKDSAVGVKDSTFAVAVAIKVLLLKVMTHVPDDPAKIRPFSAPKLQIVSALELYCVRRSLVRSSVVLPSISVTFQLNSCDALGNKTLVVSTNEEGWTIELAVAAFKS